MGFSSCPTLRETEGNASENAGRSGNGREKDTESEV